jgi:DNA-binding FadR family transcriptional regulator
MTDTAKPTAAAEPESPRPATVNRSSTADRVYTLSSSARRIRRVEKIAHVIAREIAHDIAARGLGPGTRLPPENVMLDEYEVGRASLREALRILEAYGLIYIKSGLGGGPVIAHLGSQEFGRMATLYFHMYGVTFRELVEARLVIEPVMAGQAAKRQDPDGIRRLQESLRGIDHRDDVDDGTWHQVSTEFHSIVAGISGNHILNLVGGALKDVHNARLTGTVYSKSARTKVDADHAAVAHAILRGQESRAERLMREHMQQLVRVVAEQHPGLLNEVVDWR